ncbi:MAG: hypothetical protein MHPSP_004492, partial [Paramarteilia canceri]
MMNNEIFKKSVNGKNRQEVAHIPRHDFLSDKSMSQFTNQYSNVHKSCNNQTKSQVLNNPKQLKANNIHDKNIVEQNKSDGDTIDLEKMNVNFKKNKNICIVGHVDSGKSTLIGQITSLLSQESKLDKKFRKLSFINDHLDAEQKHGVTMHTSQTTFKLDDQNSLSFVDSPGHREFVANM